MAEKITDKPNKNGKVVGVTFGAFDLCHAGHFLMFQDCKRVCDYLIVGLQDDPSIDNGRYRDKNKNSPVMSLEERRLILDGIRYIDEIFTYSDENDLYNKLKALSYDVRIIGADWEGKEYTGHDLPHKIYYNKRDHPYSSTELRDRIYALEKKKRE